MANEAELSSQSEQSPKGISQEATKATESAKELSESAKESKDTQKEIDKKLDAQKKINDANAKLDEANQKLSELPKKIEDKIDDLKKKLDILLGKVEDEARNPDSPEFDVDKLIGDFKKALNPVVSSTAPLTGVAGQIPIIGEASGMMDTMSKSSAPASSLTKEQIKEMVPTPPDIPPGIMDKIGDIGMNILTLCTTLPMMMVNVIWSMINVIYSKLKIITSVIPLGSFFPLNLLPQAIDATPKMITFMKTAPSQVKNIAKGVVKEKMAESMALAQPTPPYVDNSISATTQEIKENSTMDAYKPTEPSEQQPEEPPVVAEVTPIQPTPQPAPPTLTWDDLYEKWPKKFSKNGYYIENEDIENIIHGYQENGQEGKEVKYYDCIVSEIGVLIEFSPWVIQRKYEPKTKKFTPEYVDDMMSNMYSEFFDASNQELGYNKLLAYESITNHIKSQMFKQELDKVDKESVFEVGYYYKQPICRYRKKKSDDDDDE